MGKSEKLKALGARYATEPRQPDDIDVYEAAEEWKISPKAAEWRLNREVTEGRMFSVMVRSARNRQMRVWREVKPPRPPKKQRIAHRIDRAL